MSSGGIEKGCGDEVVVFFPSSVNTSGGSRGGVRDAACKAACKAAGKAAGKGCWQVVCRSCRHLPHLNQQLLTFSPPSHKHTHKHTSHIHARALLSRQLAQAQIDLDSFKKELALKKIEYGNLLIKSTEQGNAIDVIKARISEDDVPEAVRDDVIEVCGACDDHILNEPLFTASFASSSADMSQLSALSMSCDMSASGGGVEGMEGSEGGHEAPILPMMEEEEGSPVDSVFKGEEENEGIAPATVTTKRMRAEKRKSVPLGTQCPN